MSLYLCLCVCWTTSAVHPSFPAAESKQGPSDQVMQNTSVMCLLSKKSMVICIPTVYETRGGLCNGVILGLPRCFGRRNTLVTLCDTCTHHWGVTCVMLSRSLGPRLVTHGAALPGDLRTNPGGHPKVLSKNYCQHTYYRLP